MRHIAKVQVRFSDTDMLGHVNNARYFTFMEEARIAFFQDAIPGTSQSVPLIIASAKVNFRAQTFYPQVLRVESWVSRWGNSSFDIACEMFDDVSGALVFDGTSVLVHFDYELQKPAPVPDAYREQLVPYTHEELARR